MTSSTRLKAARAGTSTLRRPSIGGIEVDLAFPGIVFPDDPLTGQGLRQDGRGFVFVDFILLQVDHIKVILPQALQAAEIVLADRVALAESRPFKLARSDFGDIVRQLEAHGLFHFHGFNHLSSPQSLPAKPAGRTSLSQ